MSCNLTVPSFNQTQPEDEGKEFWVIQYINHQLSGKSLDKVKIVDIESGE